MSYTFTIRASELQAVLLAAPKKDVRFYLNTVMFEFAPNGFLNLVATDGHRLHALQTYLPYEEGAPQVPAGTQVLVPEDALRRIKIGARDVDGLTVTLEPNGAETWKVSIRQPNGLTLETISVDGRWPDYKRLFGNSQSVLKYGEHAAGVTLDPRFTMDAYKAIGLLGGVKDPKDYAFLYHADETQPVLVVAREFPHFVALISPRRSPAEGVYNSADIPEWVSPRVGEFA